MNTTDCFVSADATHYLECSHCCGRSRKEYVMPCVVLKDMLDGRVKLLVFGNRDWMNTEHIKRVRYVHKRRVCEIPGK